MTVPDQAYPESDEGTLYCTVHPHVETTLRCNRCGRPMCIKCAVQTPVGYRCKQCVRQQQDTFFDAQMLDYLIAGAVSLVLSLVAAAIIAALGWPLMAVILSPAAGGIIGSVVWSITRKRRGRHTATVVGIAIVLGALPLLLTNPLAIGIFMFLATSTAVARFRLQL